MLVCILMFNTLVRMLSIRALVLHLPLALSFTTTRERATDVDAGTLFGFTGQMSPGKVAAKSRENCGLRKTKGAVQKPAHAELTSLR